jgi:hypothetical protein
MVRALGYSISSFDPIDPGRLCRGRERWIDSFPTDPDAERPALRRVSVSGARFSDDSARDALRGLRFSGLSVGTIVRHLWPDSELVVWSEDGHPRHVPAEAEGVEHYQLHEVGGPLRQWYSRWSMVCADAAELDRAIEAGADVILVMDEVPEPEDAEVSPLITAPVADAWMDPTHRGGLPEKLRQDLFLLTGYRVDGAPARSFQAAAVPVMLRHCKALVLVHQDKHAPCLGLYGPTSLDPSERLDELARAQGALPVPFAIPPMLARWDRALWELRQIWDSELMGDYPVPPAADNVGGWGRRGRRRSRRSSAEE